MCLKFCFLFNSAPHLTPRETWCSLLFVREWLLSEEGGCLYHALPGKMWSWRGKDQFHGENPRRHKHQKLVFKPQIHKGSHVFTSWPCLFHVISKHMFTMEAAPSPSESVAISVRSGRGGEREERLLHGGPVRCYK